MSARREKRLRQIEKKLEALSQEAHTAKSLGLVLNNNMESIRERVNSLEIRQNFMEGQMEMRAVKADWAPVPPKRGFWHRLLNTITGRDET